RNRVLDGGGSEVVGPISRKICREGILKTLGVRGSTGLKLNRSIFEGGIGSDPRRPDVILPGRHFNGELVVRREQQLRPSVEDVGVVDVLLASRRVIDPPSDVPARYKNAASKFVVYQGRVDHQAGVARGVATLLHVAFD